VSNIIVVPDRASVLGERGQPGTYANTNWVTEVDLVGKGSIYANREWALQTKKDSFGARGMGANTRAMNYNHEHVCCRQAEGNEHYSRDGIISYAIRSEIATYSTAVYPISWSSHPWTPAHNMFKAEDTVLRMDEWVDGTTEFCSSSLGSCAGCWMRGGLDSYAIEC